LDLCGKYTQSRAVYAISSLFFFGYPEAEQLQGSVVYSKFPVKDRPAVLMSPPAADAINLSQAADVLIDTFIQC